MDWWTDDGQNKILISVFDADDFRAAENRGRLSTLTIQIDFERLRIAASVNRINDFFWSQNLKSREQYRYNYL
jgi:hypothetical protein